VIQEAINDDFSARKDGDRGGDVAMVGGNGWVAVAKCICFGTTFRLLNVWRPSSVHFHQSFRVKGSGRRSVSLGGCGAHKACLRGLLGGFCQAVSIAVP